MIHRIARGTRSTRWLGLLALVTLVALTVAACRGGDDDGADDPTPLPGEPTAAGATPAADTAPTLDARTFQALDSYRYEVSMVLASEVFAEDLPAGLDLGDAEMSLAVTGVRVNPDREYTRTVANLGFLSFTVEAITIGDQQWTREAGREWTPTSASLGGGVPGDADLRPGNVFGEDWDDEDLARFQALLDAHPYETGTVAGLATRHYTFTADEFAELFDGGEALLEQTGDLALEFDLWVSEAHGVPVRLVMLAFTDEGVEAIQLTLDVMDVNDPSLSVEAPDAE